MAMNTGTEILSKLAFLFCKKCNYHEKPVRTKCEKNKSSKDNKKQDSSHESLMTKKTPLGKSTAEPKTRC